MGITICLHSTFISTQ
uniref:Uncharacterized protein n=1 Tax=Anguilla anguilla TaxID=7936 RepID=A0A0E9UP15_ANGAN